jgi:hypothetical protein
MIAAGIAGAPLSFSRLESIFSSTFTAIIAVSLLFWLHVPPLPTAVNAGYLVDLKAGFKYIRENRAITTLFVFFALVWFLVVPAAFLSPLLVARSYGEEVWKLTANEVTFFAGSILVERSYRRADSRTDFEPSLSRAWPGPCCLRRWAGALFTVPGAHGPPRYPDAVPKRLHHHAAAKWQRRHAGKGLRCAAIDCQHRHANRYAGLGPLADVHGGEPRSGSALMAIPGVWLYMSKHAGGPDHEPGEPESPMQPEPRGGGSLEAAD